jgi:hypothetical protein
VNDLKAGQARGDSMALTEPLFPLSTNITEKTLSCPQCRFDIRIPIITNYNLGFEEVITKPSALSDIVFAQREELIELRGVLESENKRANNLYNRCRKYSKVLIEWGMFHGDENLLQLENKLQRGEFDRVD